jgi:hypothetical protein
MGNLKKYIFGRSKVNITDDFLLYDFGNTYCYSGTGVDVFDLSTGAKQSELLNGVGFSSSDGGKLLLDGTNDYVYDNASLNTGANFTINAWINPSQISDIRRCIINNGNNNEINNNGWIFFVGGASGSDNLWFTIGKDNKYKVSVNSTISSLVWQMVSVSVENNGNTIKLYKNGVELSYSASLQNSNVITYINDNFYIGARILASNDYYYGDMSYVQVQKVVATSAELLAKFNNEKSRYGL